MEVQRLECNLGEIAYRDCLLICGYRWACTIYLGKERILETLVDLFFFFFYIYLIRRSTFFYTEEG